MVGRSLGHYQILEKLGAGGMGEVYRARDPRLGRDVALKVVAPGEASSALESSLINEARQAATLSHANICHIYDVGQADGRTFFAMELVPGRTLAQEISAAGLPPDSVMRYGRQVAAALAHAHERGIIHRDLKAANVVITPDGEAKVLDFGLAKRVKAAELDELTHSQLAIDMPGTLVGTLPYMAPELLRGEPASERSDLWALGVLLYEMATGARPFGGRTAVEASTNILHQPLPALSDAWPPSLRDVIGRCLEKDPAIRCAHAREVRDALDAVSMQVPVIEAARKVPSGGARPSWVVAASVAAAAAIAVGAWWMWGRPAEPGVAGTPAASRTAVVPGAPMRPSKVPEANEHFQRAMLVAMSSLDLSRMRESYERALALDPAFAEARAEYGFSLALEVITGWSSDLSWMYRAEEEVRRALEDDPECGRAHSVLAGIYYMQGRKELVPAEVERALSLNPNDLAAYGWIALYHTTLGDYSRAEGQAQLALTLNPIFFPVRVFYADILIQKGDTAGAVRESAKLMDQAPENPSIIFNVVHAYVVAGELARAWQILEGLPPRFQGNFQVKLSRALVLAAEGKRTQAEAILDPETQKYAGSNLRSVMRMPEIYSLLDRRADALDWLDRAVRMGDERAEWFERDPLLANVRREPRFAQLVESVRYRRTQRQQQAAGGAPPAGSR